MIKLTRLDPHNLEIRDHDEDGKHRGGFSGPVAIIDAFMLMQEQAQRYRADGLFAAAGVTEAAEEKGIAYRWWLLGQGAADGANFNVAWAREQARNRHKQEVHADTTLGLLAAATVKQEEHDAPRKKYDIEDGLLPNDNTLQAAPLDTLVALWLSDQLSWKRYTEELKRRGFKPEEVAAAREEQEQEREQEKRELLGPELPTEDDRVDILNDINGVISGRLQRILRRILART